MTDKVVHIKFRQDPIRVEIHQKETKIKKQNHPAGKDPKKNHQRNYNTKDSRQRNQRKPKKTKKIQKS